MFTRWHVGLPLSRRTKRALIIISVLVTVSLGLAIIGYFLTANKIHTILPGNPLDVLTKNEPLKTADGRTNVLLFGISYDDPNPTHGGGYLTDSLIVLSIDEHAKRAYTVSIPRDLWVNYNSTCNLGRSGKVNAAYLCALKATGSGDAAAASERLTELAGSIVGLPIQYYAEVNYTYIRSLTDALGGIDVDIYSSDPRGIYDPTVGLKLPAGVSHLDGKTALKLARARNSEGGYGLPRSNFDREINQQRIVVALFTKASDGGTLSNISNALKLIDGLSGHVRTNIQASELRSAVTTARALDTNRIISVPLAGYMTTGSRNGQSIVLPVAGINDYSAVQTYVLQTISSGTGR